MAIKPIKVIAGEYCWDTKIYEGDEDITQKIGGIFGIDIRLRVDELPKMTIHRLNTKMEYVSKVPEHSITIINYEAKKTDSKEILENTSYDNAKDGKNYIKKE